VNRAVFSPCRTWRYWLERDVAPAGLTFVYFGVNGSTADETSEDQTSRKWIEFTRRNGGRRYIAVNPFAYTATDVRELATAEDPVGPSNDRFILEAMIEADVLVPCWGSRAKLPPKLRPELDRHLEFILNWGVPVLTFGFTQDGDPKHPLMLGYSTPMLPWDVAKLI
jgi:hypothetical protein